MNTNTCIQRLRNSSKQQKLLSRSKKISSTDSDEDSTQPQPSRVPQPIQQTKIRKTHCNLSSIPQCFRPQMISELYLSHNCISTVKDKLRLFVSLKNLNLSYNLLTDVHQFINEFIVDHNDFFKKTENKQRCAIQLKKLCIRMNKFDYGYEDEILKNICSLERFEDYIFQKEQKNKRGKAQENPSQTLQVARRVSEYFIPAMNKLYGSISQLTTLFSTIQDSQNPEKILPTVHLSLVEKGYQKLISKLSFKLCPKKQPKYLPSNRLHSLLTLFQYEILFLELPDTVDWHSSKQIQRNIIFGDVVRQLIQGFNDRNYFSFIQTIKNKAKIVNGFQEGKEDIDRLINVFGSTYGARKYTIYQPNPGKYLEKVNPAHLNEHPFLQLVKFGIRENQQKQNLISQSNKATVITLDGNRRKGKNTLIKELQNYVENTGYNYEKNGKDSCGSDEDSLDNIKVKKSGYAQFQLMPIIVYERNYLQILDDIVVRKARVLIKMYDMLSKKIQKFVNSQQIINPSYADVILPRSHISNKSVVELHSNAYLIQNNNYEEDNKMQSPHFVNSRTNKQKQPEAQRRWKIQLQNKDNKQNIDSWRKKTQQKPLEFSKLREQDVKQAMLQEDRKTISKFRSKKKARRMQRQVTLGNDEADLRQKKDIQSASNKQKDQKIDINLGRYSIYEISLAYKVLKALKRNSKRSKRKKTIKSNSPFTKDDMTRPNTMANTQRATTRAMKQSKITNQFDI